MKPSIDGWSIVLVGFWNPLIFLPDWVKQNLTNSPDIQFDVAIGHSAFPRLTFDNIRLTVIDQRIMIHPLNSSPEALGTAANTANKILELLHHTPISAAGVNFQFLEEAPNEDLLKCFKIFDSEKLVSNRATVQDTGIKRTIEFESKTVNYTISFTKSDNVQFDANFHKEVKNSNEAIGFLSVGINSFLQTTLNLIEKVNGSTIQAEGD